MVDAPLVIKLKEMILSEELKPGQRITEAALAERLSISRTPVRNILPGLAAEGFLETVGRRGYRVRTFSDAESWEALELRALLEGHAAQLLASNGASQDVMDALDECLADGDRLFEKRHLDLDDEQQYGVMNERFHRIVIDACGSQMLQTFVERLNRVPFVAPAVIVFDQIGLRRAFDMLFRAHGMHHSIVQAIRDRDGNRAEMLFREHAHHQRLSMFSRRGDHEKDSGDAGKRPRKRRKSVKTEPA